MRNWKNEEFIPIRELQQVLEEGIIKQTLQERNVEPYRRAEAVQSVLCGGSRTFGILCIISREIRVVEFVRQDGFLRTNLDSRLPYEEHELKRIIPDDYREFYDTQWAFSAPIFGSNLQHRILHDKCILPFQEIEEKGEGGFGVVSKVSLPGKHQAIWSSDKEKVIIIRKEIKTINVTKDESNHEQHILSLLQLLSHSNIVQFHTAFSIGGRSSLLFEIADYDLATFFQKDRPLQFTDDILLHQLFGLASGIEQIHNYFSEEYNLRMIGCHYDLTPKNILIKEDRLLLSDFGLSRLKPEAKGSDSIFKGGIGDYLAPECQNLEGDFVKHRIRRPSDIWSFGCILAEIATFLVLGPSGVEQFATKREIKFGGFLTLHTFHQGDRPHEKVLDWLNDLLRSATASDYMKELLNLVQDMIEFEVGKRPDARKVTARLFLLAETTKLRSIIKKFRSVLAKDDYNLMIQYERLMIWARQVGLEKDSQKENLSWLLELDAWVHFDKIKSMLHEIHRDLSLLEEQTKEEPSGPPSGLHCKALRTCIDRLWDTQSQSTILIMYAELENLILREVEFEELPSTAENVPGYRRLQSLIAVRQALTSLDNFIAEGENYYVDSSKLNYLADFRGRDLGYVEEPGYGKQYTFTEFLEYQDAWIDRFNLLVKRVNASVTVLKRIESLRSLPVLKCLHFCHFPDRQAFGLVYQIPKEFSLTSNGAEVQPPLTLADMIQNTLSRPKRPLLNRVFALAHKLVEAILTYHKAGRLHKSISSFNVLFFPRTLNTPGDVITEPYIVGFNYSRESDENAFTVGPTQDIELADYQHPGYRAWNSKTRFKAEFDYYSIGIVLLEVGRWKLLRYMTRKKETLSPEQLTDYLLSEEVPHLGSYMGQIYRDVVMACLDGRVGSPSKTVGASWENFERMVVGPLAKCLALNP